MGKLLPEATVRLAPFAVQQIEMGSASCQG